MELRIFVEPQEGATYEQQLAMARAAEELGFGAFFRSDHLLRIGPGDGSPGPTDSWVTLGALARETSTIRLGTMVTSATFRLPGPLAVAVAQVDAMSGGRVELGLGTGWFEAEHQAYGIPFPAFGERFERLEEQIAILTGMWSAPEAQPFSFSGRHYELQPGPALPKPVQRPHPPLIVGGTGLNRTPALAARVADEYNVAFMNTEATRARFEVVGSLCAERGRDPSTLTLSHAITVCCAREEAELAARAERSGRTVADLRANSAAGTPEQVAARLAEYREIGAERSYLQVIDIDDLDHVALIAAEVMPLLEG